MNNKKLIILKIKIYSQKIKFAVFIFKMFILKILIQSNNARLYAFTTRDTFYKYFECISSISMFFNIIYLKQKNHRRIQHLLKTNFLLLLNSPIDCNKVQFKNIFKLGDWKSNVNMFTVCLSILILFNNFFIVSSICPRLCECKWKSGKESVLCINANISNIPNNIDTGTQILDLTGNLITNIKHNIFANLELLNLQKVIFAKCRLKVIERFAFRELNNLIELDLSFNRLPIIPSHTFEFIPELREIRLSGNPIHQILNDAFLRIPKLTRIELIDCNISTIELKAFRGIEESLEWLKLNGNRLIHVIPESFTRLKNLHGLELYQNLWNCSCILRPLRIWMIREKIPFNVPPTCHTPSRLYNKSWEKIELEDFACLPNIIANQITVYAIEGRNVTLGCSIQDSGEMNIRWSLKDRLIANLSYNNFNNLEYRNNTRVSTEIVTLANHGRKFYFMNLMKNNCNLSISIVEQRDAGIYTCLAENKAGSAEAHITLIVSQKYLISPLRKNLLLLSLCIILIVTIFLLAFGFWRISLKNKRKHILLWNNIPSRCNSYEKIEMDHNIILPGNDSICNTITEQNILNKNNKIENNEENNNQKRILKTKLKNLKFYSKPCDIDKNIFENITDQTTSLNETPSKLGVTENNSGGSKELHIPCFAVDTFCNNNKPKSKTMLSLNQNSTEYFSDLEQICANGTYEINGIFTLPKNFSKTSFNSQLHGAFNSQLHLLQENNSQYDQSISAEKFRRFSDESAYFRKTDDLTQNKRCNSTLSLDKTDRKISTSSTALDFLNLNKQMYFSTTNQNETLQKYSNCEHASLFSSYQGNKKSMNHVSTSSLKDFHAAQLERFLEEYRCLQEQLCKMKETCEEICKKETSSINYKDEGIFDGVISEMNFQTSSEMLINKSLPLMTPEIPARWTYRNVEFNKLSKSPYKIYRS